jgi:lysyl-tRNA synthetase class 1
VEWNADAGTVVYEDDGQRAEVPVTKGHCKLQWKADWAMRWFAMSVDYEMSGKDLIPSVELSTKIVRLLGGAPPETFTYELFLDEQGQKISKSKGNGLSVDEWLTYGTEESLALFMFGKPHAAKKLYFDVIPKAVDEYIAFAEQYQRSSNDAKGQFENPAWFIHAGNPPAETYPVSFALLLNLVSASGAQDREVLWGFIRAYAPDADPATHPGLDRLVTYALKYYEDFIHPQKHYREPTVKEREALSALADVLENMAGERNAETVQNAVYEIGKTHGFEPLRDWFKAIYEVALGQGQGPRFGSFAALFGCAETAVLIRTALSGAFTSPSRA